MGKKIELIRYDLDTQSSFQDNQIKIGLNQLHPELVLAKARVKRFEPMIKRILKGLEFELDSASPQFIIACDENAHAAQFGVTLSVKLSPDSDLFESQLVEDQVIQLVEDLVAEVARILHDSAELSRKGLPHKVSSESSSDSFDMALVKSSDPNAIEVAKNLLKPSLPEPVSFCLTKNDGSVIELDLTTAATGAMRHNEEPIELIGMIDQVSDHDGCAVLYPHEGKKTKIRFDAAHRDGLLDAQRHYRQVKITGERPDKATGSSVQDACRVTSLEIMDGLLSSCSNK